jgi:hypothetical protein
MKTSIINIENGFAVQNENGSFVGFAATFKIAEQIKAKADANTQAVDELEKQGYSLGW